MNRSARPSPLDALMYHDSSMRPGGFHLPGHVHSLDQSLRTVVAATRPLKQAAYREAIRRLSENVPPVITDRAFRSLFSPRRAAVYSSHFAIRHEPALADDPVHAIDPITVLPLGSPAPHPRPLVQHRPTCNIPGPTG